MRKKRNTINRIDKWAYFSLFLITMFFGVTLVFHTARAVLNPTAPPPEENLPEFLRIDGIHQAKSGSLRFGSDDITSPFTYQLEVLGRGAESSNAFVENILSVSQSTRTLYVDPLSNDVCIGPCIYDPQAALEIGGGNVRISGIDEDGINAMSADAEAIIGTSLGNAAGIQGVSSNTSGYGLWAISTLSTAVEGMSTAVTPTYSSVGAFSTTGVALYGANTNLASLWSVYVAGRAESSEIITGAKVLATTTEQSLVKFTAGQVVDQYFPQYYPQRIASDGQWLWVGEGGMGHNSVLQIDKGTGRIVANYNLGPTQDLVYDAANGYIWQAAFTYPGSISRIRLSDGIAASRQVLDSDGQGTCPFGYIVLDPNDVDVLWAVQPGGVCAGRDYHDRLLKFTISDFTNNDTTWDPVARYDIKHDETVSPPFPQGARSVIYDQGTDSLWLAFHDNDAVYQIDAIDPGNGDTTIDSSEYTRYDVYGPVDLAYDADQEYVWIASDDDNDGNDGVYFIDIGGGTVSSRIPVHTGSIGPQAITYDGETVWVATTNGTAGSLDSFPATNTSSITHYPTQMAESFQDVLYDPAIDTVWVPSWYGNAISGVNATDGVVEKVFDYGQTGFVARYYDGTYLWVTRHDILYKVRATDGLTVYAVTVGDGPTAVLTDSSAVWVTVGDDDVVLKLDPYTGTTMCSLALNVGDAPESIVFDGMNYWVAARGSGDIIKISNTCVERDRLSVTNVPNSLQSLMYNGSFLWAVSQEEDGIVNINPSTGEAVLWIGLSGLAPSDIIFDNFHYWVPNSDGNSITAFYLSEVKVCSQNQSLSCSTDTDCAGAGGCFAVPQIQGAYATDTEPTAALFDGTHIWTINQTGQSLTRLFAAQPSVRQDIPLGFTPEGLLFDGSYLWTSGSSVAGYKGINKIFAGVGYGQQSLEAGLTLQSGTAWSGQPGSYAISGDARIGKHALIAGDLVAPNNSWGNATSGSIIFNNSAIVWSGFGSLPDGGQDVSALIRATNGILYAGATTVSGGRIFISTDNAQTWSNSGGPSGGIIYAIYESANGDIYVGSGSGDVGYIYRSTDQGTTWPLIRQLNGQGPVQAFLEDDAGILYAGAGYGGTAYVYASSDGGATWNNTGSLTGAEDVHDLIQIDNGSILAATGTTNGNVLRTTDRGATWNNTGNLTNAEIVHDLLQTTDGTLYAATQTGVTGQVVFMSTDRGTTWTLTGDATGAVQGYSLVQTSDGALYLAADSPSTNQLYRSENGGTSWNQLSGLPAGTSAFVIVDSGEFPRYDMYVGLGSTDGVGLGSFAPLPPGTHACPHGQFVTNIETNDVDEVLLIECRPL